jgi:hypothetical protein
MKNLRIFLIGMLTVVLISCGDDDEILVAPTAPTGSVSAASAVSGESVTLTGNFSDAQGLSSIVIVGSDLGINSTITLAGELSYAMSEEASIPAGTAAGSYDVSVTVKNTEELTESLTITVTVSDPPCTDTIAEFAGKTVSGTSSSYGYDPFDPSFTVTIDGDQLTLAGAVSDYHGSDLTVTVVPDSEDPTKGTLTWTEELLGDDGYGAIYHLIPTVDLVSTYDACAGTMTIYSTYEWNYEAGAGWEHWYDAVFELTVEN